MTKAEAGAELGAILRLLREHAFLRYSASGAAEWDQKLRGASAAFTALASRASGVPLPDPHPYSGIESASRADAEALRSLARRCAARLAAAAAGAESPAAERLSAAAAAWKRAAAALAAPGRG